MKLLVCVLLLLIASASILASCRSPQPIAEIEEVALPPRDLLVPAGIDEQIFRSDIIVVASFVSATAGVQTVPGGIGVSPTFRPMQVLTFRASEYLKGTGPAIFTVEVLDGRTAIYTEGNMYEGYLTSDAAMTEARQLVADRNTTWDDRPGVLFLKGPLSSAASSTDAESGATRSSSGQSYGFALFNFYADGSFAYSMDTNARAWLPDSEAPTSGATGRNSVSSNPEYIIDVAKNPPPVTSLAELKTRIGEIAAMRTAGDGSKAYEECLYRKFTRERAYRDGWSPPVDSITIESGQPKGTTLYQSSTNYYDDYSIRTTSGPDADLFKVITIDDDTDASNGHSFARVTTRPLSKGEYTVNFHTQIGADVICDHNPTDTNYNTSVVTVIAPSGTLHEVFFDPTAAGTDDVSPAEFTAGGTATEISGLRWTNNQVVLTLDPHVSLSGHVLDFIALDGSVSLSLFTDSATVDSAAGTHSWLVTTEPWENGDQLMVRIREG